MTKPDFLKKILVLGKKWEKCQKMWFFVFFSETSHRIFLKFSKFIQLSVLHNPAKTACLKNPVLEIFWKRISANQIASFFKSQYLMNFLSRYVHILHGGRPYWEEVIDLFYDVTCLPKHARACPYRTEIALSPILLWNNVYFLNLNQFNSAFCIIKRKPHV